MMAGLLFLIASKPGGIEFRLAIGFRSETKFWQFRISSR